MPIIVTRGQNAIFLSETKSKTIRNARNGFCAVAFDYVPKLYCSIVTPGNCVVSVVKKRSCAYFVSMACKVVLYSACVVVSDIGYVVCAPSHY